MARREAFAWALVAALVALAGGVAWVTRHPESPLLEQAEQWPGVGPALAALRRQYLSQPPAPPEETVRDRTLILPAPPPVPAVEETAQEEVVVSGRPAEALWVAPGDRVLARPAEAARVVATVDRYRPLARYERRGDWHRVRWQGRDGWVLRPVPAAGEPPFPATPEPPRPLPGRAPDPARLAAAVRLLGEPAAALSEPPRHLGAYRLLTDLDDPALLARLGRLAGDVERLYPLRYGVTPVGPPAETVLLFAREPTYREFQALDARLASLPATGHTGDGLVALFAGGRRPDEVAATLVHELTHLLNRRSLGPALPPWLDEGLAVDLALSAIGADGSLHPERVGGAALLQPPRITYFGGRASARHLESALAVEAGLPPLGELFALDWEPFVRSERLEIHYAAAGFFWRTLLDGSSRERTASARDFLRSVAAGGPADAETLRARLGTSWDTLRFELGRTAAVAAADAAPAP